MMVKEEGPGSPPPPNIGKRQTKKKTQLITTQWANPTPKMEQQRTMAEQKTTRPRSQGAKASKNEGTTSGASGRVEMLGMGISFLESP